MTNMNYDSPPVRRRPEFSVPSVIAVIAAVGSFFAGPGLALFLAIVAILAAIFGFFLALQPSVRGGMLSMLSFVLGAIGIIAAIVRFIVR